MIVGAVVRFDRDAGEITAVYPLGDGLGRYVDCAAGSDVCDYTVINQADLRFLDGHLVIVDRTEDGKVFTMNSEDGSVVVAGVAPGTADWTETTMLAGDRAHVWLQVRRLTVVSERADGSSTATEELFLERLNTETGKIDIVLRASDIFF